MPNISNWNTNNIIKMNGLFYGCSSLKSIPDISNWNTNDVINLSEFNGNKPSTGKRDYFHKRPKQLI